jgi:protein-S-isoprenylcysteine O-methyltransferase Ste14
LGKTFYLRKKEKLNTIMLRIGRRGKNGFLSTLSVLVVNIWIACLLLYLLNASFYKWLSVLEVKAIDNIWVKITGLLVLVLAFTIFIMAQIALGNSWRLGIDRTNPGKLVTGNIYNFSRHPIYLFFVLYFFSIFLLNANIVFLLFTMIIAAILHFQAASEEDFLIGIYGAQYKEYASRTGKYITLSRSDGRQVIMK